MKLTMNINYIFVLLSHLMIVKIQANLNRYTENGWIVGSRKISRANNSIEYFAFQGIPYAQPPLGTLRFQEPLRAKNWKLVKSATREDIMCVQLGNFGVGTDVLGDEDCLYLNVYVPKDLSQKNVPVMVWIHGGTFLFSSGGFTENGPDYFMDKQIILVSINYRLNVFGFLSTGDDNAPGNIGLKDQVMALKWVQRNIKYFNGNPNKVTIFGASAGGASVQYHMLSPLSKDLFQQAISQSGSTLNRWAFRRNSLKMTSRLAQGLHINTISNVARIRALQKVDSKDLIRAAFNASIMGFKIPYYAPAFTVTVEREGINAFLSESTLKLWETGKYTRVPYILGYDSEEGAFAYGYISTNVTDINIYERTPNLLIPSSLNVKSNSSISDEIVDKITSFYFMDGQIRNITNFVDYMSEDLFVRGIQKVVSLIYGNGLTYVYKFSFNGSRNTGLMGTVGHYDEVSYMFYREGPIPRVSSTNTIITNRLITLWTNFASYGNPTPQKDELFENVIWPKGGTTPLLLNIGNNIDVEVVPLHNDTQQTDFEFWKNIFDNDGNPPYFTY